MNPKSNTLKNLESAFAGESMAHVKYRYFAKLARTAGDEATAKVFADTADQELLHAFGHLDLLYPPAQMTPAKSLAIAIEGETYEYTTMYPQFRHMALQEGNAAAVAEIDEQIEESKLHAAQFVVTLEKAAKRFAGWPRWKSATPIITSSIYKRYSPSKHSLYSLLQQEHVMNTDFQTYVCIVCGFVYDEAHGRPEDGIAAGTRWVDVPESWECPDCGVAKADFEVVAF